MSIIIILKAIGNNVGEQFVQGQIDLKNQLFGKTEFIAKGFQILA
jgi:hypothetical protein